MFLDISHQDKFIFNTCINEKSMFFDVEKADYFDAKQKVFKK